LLGYGIAIHLVELYIFYISSVIIQSDLAIKSVLILFTLNFILDRIPLISNIPGINEILFRSINNTSSVLNTQIINIPHTLEVSYINKKYVKDPNHHLNKPNIANKDLIELSRDFFS
jgi:hypothetical protein